MKREVYSGPLDFVAERIGVGRAPNAYVSTHCAADSLVARRAERHGGWQCTKPPAGIAGGAFVLTVANR